MGKLRLAAVAATLTVAAFAAPAFAQVSSAADCDYEGGEVFNVQGATVCLVQIRPEEYRDNEAYDGQQLGVSECNGDTLSNGTFCKITLVAAPAKPEVETPVEPGKAEDAVDAMDEETN
jgi:hypothetical protein